MQTLDIGSRRQPPPPDTAVPSHPLSPPAADPLHMRVEWLLFGHYNGRLAAVIRRRYVCVCASVCGAFVCACVCVCACVYIVVPPPRPHLGCVRVHMRVRARMCA